MNILNVNKLSHRYSSDWAIKDIDFDIATKGVIGLVGANGAGKSTLMNIICGTLKPTSGEVLLNGANLATEPLIAKREVGFLPQTLPLYLNFSVREYLSYAGELRLLSPNDVQKAVEEVLEKCQLSHMANRLLRNLSGGYRQRVGIAQSIIHKPSLVVMDEPTTGLDPNQLIEVRKLIREISKDCTVLLSSHIMQEIQALCQEIIMIESGQMVFHDSMESFDGYLKPSSLVVLFDATPDVDQLRQISGVRDVVFLKNNTYRIFFNEDDDLSMKIIEMSVQHRWRLKEISVEKDLLDDVFKHLSQGQHRDTH